MTQDNPLLLAGVGLGMVALFVLWFFDMMHARLGKPKPGAFPGAMPTFPIAVVIGVVGVVVLLAIEIGGEYALGIVEEQSRMSWAFAVFTLVAAFGEELVFRGYLVAAGRGRTVLITSMVVFSALFALAHQHLWRWNGALVLTFSVKAWFSTVMIFAGSMWFYFLRFQPKNPTWSLIPCIVAHFTKNLLVIIVKASQGYVG